MKKLRVGILFGGRSGEHEVSLLSAASVLNAIDKNKYEVVPIGITKEGRWLTAGDAELLLQGKALVPPSHIYGRETPKRLLEQPCWRPDRRLWFRQSRSGQAEEARWLPFRPRL